jgi:hypothetical protein
MSGRLNHAKQRRLITARLATRGTIDHDPPRAHPTSLKGWRLTDGADHPVTVSHMRSHTDRTSDREDTHDDQPHA